MELYPRGVDRDSFACTTAYQINQVRMLETVNMNVVALMLGSENDYTGIP